ncbi:MAG TPA: hypothetical protein VHO70_13555 [Chitinispirillaceae bacterium]|nr:hypothetical protein [Chitinispirillaceae bacterium]
MNFGKLIMPLTGAFFFSCYSVTVKPLITVYNPPSCEFVKDESFSITQIEKNIKRYNPVESQVILLNTNWGNPLKTLKVYKFFENSEMKYLLLFHVRERAGDDISQSGKMTIITGSENTDVEITHDASVFIADISDLYFYTCLSELLFKKVISQSESKFNVASYQFQLSNECKSILTF